MVRLWLVAAVALVAGILIGFASGFTAAGRLTAPPLVTNAPETPAEPSSSGRPFSEAAVPESVRVEPEPVVPTAEPEPEPVKAPPPARRQTQPPARSMERAPAVQPAATGPGSMQIVSRPSGAQVILDGRDVGRTPLTLVSVPDGTHAVRLELTGFKPWATTVDVTPGQRTRVAASLEE
jgi:hypothetical protein